jgi:hypothetical protein
MTRVLLCAGSGLLVLRKDGLFLFRQPGQPDTPVPYAPERYPEFLRSAVQKYDLTPVVGPQGQEEHVLPDEAPIPELRLEHLPNGATRYRVVEGHAEPHPGNQLETDRRTAHPARAGEPRV